MFDRWRRRRRRRAHARELAERAAIAQHYREVPIPRVVDLPRAAAGGTAPAPEQRTGPPTGARSEPTAGTDSATP